MLIQGTRCGSSPFGGPVFFFFFLFSCFRAVPSSPCCPELVSALSSCEAHEEAPGHQLKGTVASHLRSPEQPCSSVSSVLRDSAPLCPVCVDRRRMPTFTMSSSFAALPSCSICSVVDCREIDRRRNAVAGRTVLTTALVLHAECAGNRGGACGSNVAEAGRRHAVRAAESDGPERRDRQDVQNRHRLHLRAAGGRGNLRSVPVSHPAQPPSTSTSPRMTRNPVPPTRASAHMGWRGLACVWCMPSAAAASEAQLAQNAGHRETTSPAYARLKQQS